MKRVLPILVISLLFASGWGPVLAAAFCPRMQAEAPCPMPAGDHHASSHEAMMTGEASDMRMSETTDSGVKLIAATLPAGSCTHCLSAPESPASTAVAPFGAAGQSGRDTDFGPRPPARTFAPPTSSFVPPVAARPHSPPGAQTPLHVLVGVFQI